MLWVQAEFPVCIQSFPLCFPKLVQIAGRETSLGIATSSRDGCEAGGTLGVLLHPSPPCPLPVVLVLREKRHIHEVCDGFGTHRKHLTLEWENTV